MTKNKKLLQLLAPYRDKTLSFGCEVNVCRDYDSFTSERSVDYKLKARIIYVEKTDLHYEGGGETLIRDTYIYRVEFDKYCGDEETDVEEGELEILGHPPTLATVLMALQSKEGHALIVSIRDNKLNIGDGLRVDITQTPDQYSEEVSGALVELLSK